MPDAQLLDNISQVVQHDGTADAGDCQTVPVAGGDINTSFLLAYGSRRYFVKTLERSGAAAMHAAEANALQALQRSAAIRVPAVVGLGEHGSTSFLVLQELTLTGPNNWEELGHALAALHGNHAPKFGWPEDNFIGTTVQRNRQHSTWSEFWWQERLQPQLQLAYSNGYRRKLEPYEQTLQELSQHMLGGHQPSPSLVHGDLWSGNIGFLEDGQPAVFDPACYYGDREVDLAMSQLFGGFGEAFYQSYEAARPLAQGYQQRFVLYNLYHLLNHLNLFGRGYLSQCIDSIKQLRGYC